eukprot:3031781-Amphidinium_carterae.2
MGALPKTLNSVWKMRPSQMSSQHKWKQRCSSNRTHEHAGQTPKPCVRSPPELVVVITRLTVAPELLSGNYMAFNCNLDSVFNE